MQWRSRRACRQAAARRRDLPAGIGQKFMQRWVGPTSAALMARREFKEGRSVGALCRNRQDAAPPQNPCGSRCCTQGCQDGSRAGANEQSDKSRGLWGLHPVAKRTCVALSLPGAQTRRFATKLAKAQAIELGRKLLKKRYY